MTNKKIAVIFSSAVLCMTVVSSPAVMAQTKDGGISQQMINDIRKAQKMTTADKAIANAIASNAIDNLAKNHANALISAWRRKNSLSQTNKARDAAGCSADLTC